MGCPATYLVTQEHWKACVRALRNALTGLEALSDLAAANYLNQHPGVVSAPMGLATPYTADMVHEARTAKI